MTTPQHLCENEIKKQVVEDLLGPEAIWTNHPVTELASTFTNLCILLNASPECILNESLLAHLMNFEVRLLALPDQMELISKQTTCLLELCDEKEQVKNLLQGGEVRKSESSQLQSKIKAFMEETQQKTAEVMEYKRKLQKINFDRSISDSNMKKREERLTDLQRRLKHLEDRLEKYKGLEARESDIIHRIQELKTEQDNMEARFRRLSFGF